MAAISSSSERSERPGAVGLSEELLELELAQLLVEKFDRQVLPHPSVTKTECSWQDQPRKRPTLRAAPRLQRQGKPILQRRRSASPP